ncbi:MAG: ABC transporter permease [Clostridiales bacterium]|nr:ABC transporter permease [Clostridiales bacterium]
MKINIKKLLTEYNIVVIMGFIAVAAFLWVPFFSKTNNLFKLTADFSMYGIVAVGMSFLLISGEVDLSLGVSVALSTILSSLIGSSIGGVAGIIAAVGACSLIGLVNGLIVTKIRMSSLIASIAMMTALTGICYLIGDGKTVPNTSELIRSLYTFRLFGLKILQLPNITFLLFLLVGGLVLRYTRFGTGIYVAGGNPEAGYMSGVNIGRTKLICFVIGGFCAGVTGVLMASYVFAGAVSYGEGLNLTVISACVLGGVKFTGGKGGMIRTLLGIMVVRAIINITSLLSFDAWAQNMVTGILLLVVLIVDRFSRVLREEDCT